MKKIIATVCASTILVSSSAITYTPAFTGELVKSPTQQLFKSEKEKADNFMKYVDDYVKEQERLQKIEQYKQSIQQERQRMAELEYKKQQEQNKLKQYDRGGNITYTKMEVNVKITYYTNINNRIQGGQYDKKGIPLKSHDMPVCALPSNIPYGSLIEIDGLMYLSCDTGGAIKWIDNNTMRVDIFIPDVTEGWINRNKKIETKKAILYIKNN